MRSSARYTAYIFDFDGTLFDLPVDWKAVRRDLYALTRVQMDEVSIFKVIGELTSSNPSLRPRLFAAIDAHEWVAAELATPVDGALDLIPRLASTAGVALVTMQGRTACTRVLERHGVVDRFRVILTREDSLERSKQLAAACRALETDPKEVLFVGDKRSDLAAGRDVGIEVAVVGKRAKKEWGADHFFTRLQELQSFLG